MPAPPRDDAFPVAAVVVDALAGALLVVVLVLAFRTTVVAAVPLAVLDVPLAILGATLSAGALIRRAPRGGRRVAVGVGAVVLAVAAVPIGSVLLLLAGDLGARYGPNPAGAVAAALGSVVEQDGGARVCGRGDPGLGPDNVRPWYDAVYAVPPDDRLQGRLERRAAREGWEVVPNADAEAGTVPQVLIDTGLLSVGDACGTVGRTESAPAGRRLVRLLVQVPAR